MIRIVVVAGALLLGVGAVAAQQDVVNERQATMKNAGRNLGGVLSAMAKGDKPYDQAAVNAALTELSNTAKKIPALFPDSTKGLKGEGDYSASTKVWDSKTEFLAQNASFEKTVAEASTKIKDLDSLKATVPAIGKSCGGCHETFRLKS